MNVIRSAIVTVALSLGAVCSASAQYIFLDTNGDAKHDPTDHLETTGTTTVHVWLQTDINRDGSASGAYAMNGIPVSIFSYQFTLHASGGAVQWGAYTNILRGRNFKFGEMRSATDFFTGFSGDEVLPPGKYELGRLTVRVVRGYPTISFVSEAPQWGVPTSGFGSLNPGKDADNTIKFGEASHLVSMTAPNLAGDWGDADGIQAGGLPTESPKEAFRVSLSPNPINPEAILSVSTTEAGFLKVRVFEVGGRLVRTLVDQKVVPAGRYEFRLRSDGRTNTLASGMYFYKVEAAEGRRIGKVVVLK